jgi:hypothetical protein
VRDGSVSHVAVFARGEAITEELHTLLVRRGCVLDEREWERIEAEIRAPGA